MYIYTPLRSSAIAPVEAAALVTIGEIYSMNGKKDEARKAGHSDFSPALSSWFVTWLLSHLHEIAWSIGQHATPNLLSTASIHV